MQTRSRWMHWMDCSQIWNSAPSWLTFLYNWSKVKVTASDKKLWFWYAWLQIRGISVALSRSTSLLLLGLLETSFMFSLLLAASNCWTNGRYVGDFRCHVTISISLIRLPGQSIAWKIKVIKRVIHSVSISTFMILPSHYHIEAETKLPLFRRRHFQRHFCKWKNIKFAQDFTEVCSLASN